MFSYQILHAMAEVVFPVCRSLWSTLKHALPCQMYLQVPHHLIFDWVSLRWWLPARNYKCQLHPHTLIDINWLIPSTSYLWMRLMYLYSTFSSWPLFLYTYINSYVTLFLISPFESWCCLAGTPCLGPSPSVCGVQEGQWLVTFRFRTVASPGVWCCSPTTFPSAAELSARK